MITVETTRASITVKGTDEPTLSIRTRTGSLTMQATGMRGPKGERGEPGPPGPAAQDFDYPDFALIFQTGLL